MRGRSPFVIAVMLVMSVALTCIAGLAAATTSHTGLAPTFLRTYLGALRGEIIVIQKERAEKPRPIYGGNQVVEAPADERAELHVIVISDLNGRYGSTEYGEFVHAAVREIIDRRPDIVLSTGDMVAGQREGLDYRAMWQSFHAAVTRPLAQAGIPLLITPGNHDAATSARFAHERAIFVDEWNLHRPKIEFVDDSNYPIRYSAVMGSTFFISLDATAVGALPREQMVWLERQLAASQDYDNRIVFGHVPLWASSIPKRREIIGDPALEELFNKYRVSAYISGHHHSYFPGARGELRLISMPCLGSGVRRLIAPDQDYAPRGLVEFIAAKGGLYDVDAWRAPRFDERIARESLPPKVGTARGLMVRDDLLGLNLRSRQFLDKRCLEAGVSCVAIPSAAIQSPMPVVPPTPARPSVDVPRLPDGLGN